MDDTVLVEFSEVKAKWLSLYYGEKWHSQPNFDSQERFRKGGPWNKFQACSPDEMFQWVQNGFTSPEFPISDEYTPHREDRRMIFSDEGELDLTLAWSGHDFPYLSWETIPKKPGIRIVAQFQFSASVKSKVITEYGAWLAGILSGLESQGYDIELDLACLVSKLYTNSSYGSEETVLVRVKRENELTDFSEWSALFSPGGFRMLFFTALALAGDKSGRKVNGSLGIPRAHKFDAQYETDTATLTISTNGSAGKFPLEEMSNKVREALQ